jgi:fluoride exporter
VRFLGVALGGALGAVLRWWLGELVPATDGFPWVTFAINVSGAAALAALPLLPAVRRSPGLAAALGPGLLGGYTTLSAYSEQARALLDAGRTATALTYLLGTLVACLIAVALVSRAAPEPGR